MTSKISISTNEVKIMNNAFKFIEKSETFIEDCQSQGIQYKKIESDLKNYVENLNLIYNELVATYNSIMQIIDKYKSSDIIQNLRDPVNGSKNNIDKAKSELDNEYNNKLLDINALANVKSERLSKTGQKSSRRSRKGGKRTNKRYTRKYKKH